VLRTGEPELVEEETSERLTADVGDPEALANELSGIVPTSSIYAPLVARGRTIGAIALLSAESGRRYGSDDLELAVELARRAAVAVDNARLYREATESLAQLEAVLVSAPVGVGFWDRELRYVRVNDALAAINRLPAAEHMGRPLRTVVPQLADALEPLYQRVLDTGEPVVHQESTNPDASALGGERHWLSSYFPVRAEDETIGVGAVILEITDRERAQQRARFVARASEILASSLIVEEVMPAIAEHAVESFCDSCTVWTLDDGTLHRIARANASSERAQALAELDSYDLAADADVPLVRVVRTGRAYHVPALDDDELRRAARSAEEAELLTTHAALSLMILPLVVRGRIFGAVALGSRAPGRHDDNDYAAAEELARRIAVHLDRVGLHAEATETAALLRAVVEQMPSGLAIADAATGQLLLHNEQAEVIWRRPWSEATVWEHAERSVGFHPDGRRYTPEEWPFARAVSEGELVAAEEIEIERGDGSRGVIEVSAAPVRDGKGKVVAGVATFDDVTARREAESRLRESARAAQALEFVGDGVFLIDGEGRVALWNPAAAAITGIAREEVVGRSADEALAGWPLDRLGDRTETHPVELDNRELWLSLSAVQFPEGTVYAFRDLTEEYAVERLKSDFVSTVSHELRTPLAAIYGAAMTLQRVDVSLAEDQRIGLLGVVANESERLARIVNDVLWASRLDSGVLAVSIESCDPATLAAAVVNAARVHVPPGIELSLNLEPSLPDVAADPDKVRQVLVNLVDNAIKYSPDGGLVEVRVAAGEHTVRFTVSDPGLGIPPPEHARIFEKFYRLDPNLTRGVGGTGLGLYICRELVRRMDGRIWVDSEEGSGSTFTFELPVAAR
jgi:PAS domain S-box-containing protein